MTSNIAPLWQGANIPKRVLQMSCIELVNEYKKTNNPILIVQLILLVDGSERRLAVVLYNILKDYTIIDDFFQSLFLFLSNKLKENHSIQKCRGWFYTLVKNRAINEYNKRSRHREKTKRIPVNETSIQQAEEQKIVNKIDALQKIDDMKAALKNIEKGWECVQCRWYGNSYTQCANNLKLTFTQYRGRYQRSSNLLREKFGEDYEKYFEWAQL